MRDVFGSRNWVFWWAAITATVFLKAQLPTIQAFFQDSGFFSPNTFPFSLVKGLNDWLDGLAQGIQSAVQFNPNQPIITSPVTIPNSFLAVAIGILVLVGAIGLYARALKSSSVGDDVLTLLALYFILRIEAYILGISNIGPLAGAGTAFVSNPVIGFWLLMFFIILLVFLGGGLSSRRAFWRGLLEIVLIALFVQPTETAQLIGAFFGGLYTFANLLGSNLVVGVAWGVLGAVLALTRLTSAQTA